MWLIPCLGTDAKVVIRVILTTDFAPISVIERTVPSARPAVAAAAGGTPCNRFTQIKKSKSSRAGRGRPLRGSNQPCPAGPDST